MSRGNGDIPVRIQSLSDHFIRCHAEDRETLGAAVLGFMTEVAGLKGRICSLATLTVNFPAFLDPRRSAAQGVERVVK